MEENAPRRFVELTCPRVSEARCLRRCVWLLIAAVRTRAATAARIDLAGGVPDSAGCGVPWFGLFADAHSGVHARLLTLGAPRLPSMHTCPSCAATAATRSTVAPGVLIFVICHSPFWFGQPILNVNAKVSTRRAYARPLSPITQEKTAGVNLRSAGSEVVRHDFQRGFQIRQHHQISL